MWALLPDAPPRIVRGMPTCFFLLSEGDAVPEWVRIMPLGEFRASAPGDKRGPWRLTNAQAVIDASMAGGRLAVDENHSTDRAAPMGQPSPARGWMTEMEARADGIYAHIDWTDAGRQLMADKAYRGFSPVFTSAKDGAVERILRLAITNNPALTELNLLTHQETQMDLAQLRTAVGLSETADETAILAAVRANAQAVAAHAQTMTAITSAVGLAADTSVDALVTALAAAKGTAGDAAQLRQQIVTLEGRLTTLQTQQSLTAATAFVDAAIKAGKPIVALRDHYIKRHQADREAVETEINALVSINAGGAPPDTIVPQAELDAVALTAEDKSVCLAMGLKEEDFLKHKKDQLATKGGSR